MWVGSPRSEAPRSSHHLPGLGWGGWAPNLKSSREFISVEAELPVSQAAKSPEHKHLNVLLPHLKHLPRKQRGLRMPPRGVCSQPDTLATGVFRLAPSHSLQPSLSISGLFQQVPRLQGQSWS